MPATRPRRMLVANPRAPPARLRTCEDRVRRSPRRVGGRRLGRRGRRRLPAIPLPRLDLAESLGGGVRGGPAARRATRARRRRPAGRHPAALRDRARRARAARGRRGLRLSRPHRRRRPRGRRVGGAPRVARRRRRALDPPRGARRVADRARAARAGGDGRAGGRRHAGGALSGPGIAVVLGDLPARALARARAALARHSRRDRARPRALRLPARRRALQARVRAPAAGRASRGDRAVGMSLRVAMLSVHTCPLAALGGKETGGMNVYVREHARELARMGAVVDVFTRSQNPDIPRVVRLAEGARVIHLPAGPQAPMARERVHEHLDEFVDGVETWRLTNGLDYDLLHGNYWLSGVAGLALRALWGVPLVQMFHTLGALKNGAAVVREHEPALRVAEERRIVAAADRLVAANAIE